MNTIFFLMLVLAYVVPPIEGKQKQSQNMYNPMHMQTQDAKINFSEIKRRYDRKPAEKHKFPPIEGDVYGFNPKVSKKTKPCQA